MISFFDSIFLQCFSYAREWQAKLRELQESTQKLSNNRRSPCKDLGPLPLPLTLTTSSSNHGPAPIVSITASPKRTSPHGTKVKAEAVIKMDSNGALNLASSPSPPAHVHELTSTSDSPLRRSPNGGINMSNRPTINYGVEMCVVCGDRASGKTKRTSLKLVIDRNFCFGIDRHWGFR